MRVRRNYLIKPDQLPKCRAAIESHFGSSSSASTHEWTDTFYDTKSHQLSNAECILMKDSDSPQYWKFFCYAHDNIMELTTDEQDIKEPLSRLLKYDSPADVKNDLLKVCAGCLRGLRCIRTDEPWCTAGLRKQGETGNSKLTRSYPFFTINNSKRTFERDGVRATLEETDYGFVHSEIEVVLTDDVAITKALDTLSGFEEKFGFSSLTDYNAKHYL